MSFSSNLRHALLGRDPTQQLRVSQSLLVLVVYLVFAAVQHVEVLLGLIDARQSWVLTAWNLAGGIGFYALVRAGVHRRLRRDRPLAMAEQLWAMVGITWSYAITGAARGAVMLIMLVVVLYGMFVLTASQSRWIVGAGVGLLGSAMLWKALADPLRYPPAVEALHFLFFCIVMAVCAELSIRIGALRARLERQRNDLGDALQRIQALATRDALTGLLNRRAAMDRLLATLQDRRGTPPQLAVALIDLDHFKRINDQHGHAAGDRALRHFADIAQATLRETDLLARWGGEEFLLAMPGAEPAQALRALERVRAALRAAPLPDLAPGFVVGFSAGVDLCRDVADLERAIERADAAMYAAKAAGRDRSFAPADCATLAVS